MPLEHLAPGSPRDPVATSDTIGPLRGAGVAGGPLVRPCRRAGRRALAALSMPGDEHAPGEE